MMGIFIKKWIISNKEYFAMMKTNFRIVYRIPCRKLDNIPIIQLT